MSYLVLARKLRPMKFKDLVGQDAICRTLINAISSNRVAHAFLFTGPRGTGKTSCARILTKALNCQSPDVHEPCNQCENCKEINQGISTDVIEIDAASNRGIEHIRELRESVNFSPAKCTYKTYIIDEVHMLTPESFNALLKTLEEPPVHVKFILATTDHHKIPSTVISRCQRYDFSNISNDVMVDYLKQVVSRESIEISESALYLIAKSSSGGMRDALTTLDMLIGFNQETIQEDKVIEVLGLNDEREIDELLKAIINKDLDAAFAIFEDLVKIGRSQTRIVTDLMAAVKNISLVKTLSGDKIRWHDFLPDQLELYKNLSRNITIGTLHQYFNLLLEIESQIKRSTQAQICIEMGIVKMCSLESLAGVAEVISALRAEGTLKKKVVLKPNLTNDAKTSTVNEPAVIGGGLQKAGEQELVTSYVQEYKVAAEDLPREIGVKANPPNIEYSNNFIKQPNQEERQPVVQTEIKNNISRKWEEFVAEIAKKSNKLVVSLLRNSVVLKLDDQCLEIGNKSLNLFTEEKKQLIEEIAKQFFSPSIQVSYLEKDHGIDDSIKSKQDTAKKIKLEEIKLIAKNDSKVLQVMQIFPKSEIKAIKILKEEEVC